MSDRYTVTTKIPTCFFEALKEACEANDTFQVDSVHESGERFTIIEEHDCCEGVVSFIKELLALNIPYDQQHTGIYSTVMVRYDALGQQQFLEYSSLENQRSIPLSEIISAFEDGSLENLVNSHANKVLSWDKQFDIINAKNKGTELDLASLVYDVRSAAPDNSVTYELDISAAEQEGSFQNATLSSIGDIAVSIAIYPPALPFPPNQNDIVELVKNDTAYLRAKGWKIDFQVGQEDDPTEDAIFVYIDENNNNVIDGMPYDCDDISLEENGFFWSLTVREDLIDNLIVWISECGHIPERQFDKALMTQDLKLLFTWKDEYIWSSNETNKYVSASRQPIIFNEICNEYIAVCNGA